MITEDTEHTVPGPMCFPMIVIEKWRKYLELSKTVRIFAPSECRQRARTICFRSKIQAGPF